METRVKPSASPDSDCRPVPVINRIVREFGGHLTVEPSGNQVGNYFATYEFPSGNLCIRAFPSWPTEEELLDFLTDTLSNHTL